MKDKYFEASTKMKTKLLVTIEDLFEASRISPDKEIIGHMMDFIHTNMDSNINTIFTEMLDLMEHLQQVNSHLYKPLFDSQFCYGDMR